jgi:hypothetical protein
VAAVIERTKGEPVSHATAWKLLHQQADFWP